MSGPALDGVRVLAIEHFIAGPFATMWLADQGAEVVKVEPPGAGEPMRQNGPFRQAPNGEQRGLGLLRMNRNKLSISLDLKSPDGKAIFEELVKTADVVLENLRPNSMEDLGLGWSRLQELNPRLVYTSVSGYGHQGELAGPYTAWPAMDPVIAALSGLLFRPDHKEPGPVALGFSLMDVYTGTVACLGTLQALFQRERTGVGQHVDVAMYDSALVLNESAIALQAAGCTVPAHGLLRASAPLGIYPARDGYLSVAVMGAKMWLQLCHAMGRPELAADASLHSMVERNRRSIEVDGWFESWLSTLSRDEAVAKLQAAGIPAAPVVDVDEVVKAEQVAARRMLVTLDDPAWGQVRVVGNPIKTSLQPAPHEAGAAPAAGQHTRELLSKLLGLSEQRLEELASRSVI